MKLMNGDHDPHFFPFFSWQTNRYRISHLNLNLLMLRQHLSKQIFVQLLKRSGGAGAVPGACKKGSRYACVLVCSPAVSSGNGISSPNLKWELQIFEGFKKLSCSLVK